MKIMADAINFMAVINEQDEEKMTIVEELIYYIDGMLKDFRTAMRSRNTKRKNRKAVATAVLKLASVQRGKKRKLLVGEVNPSTSSGTVHSTGSGTAPLTDSETAVSSDLLTVESIDSESVHLIGEPIASLEKSETCTSQKTLTPYPSIFNVLSST